MDEFKVGDIVQLKSGGPKMTITSTGLNGPIYCKWFSGSKLNSGNFPKDVLENVKEDKSKKNES